jgi:hypothetical protein
MKALPILAALGLALTLTACTRIVERRPAPPVVVQPAPATPSTVIVRPTY